MIDSSVPNFQFTASSMSSTATILDEMLFSCNTMLLYQMLERYYLLKEPIMRQSLHRLNSDLLLLLDRLGGCTSIGIDLPVYLSSTNNSGKVLLICGMDPLTPLPASTIELSGNENFPDEFSLGAPFSILDHPVRPKGSYLSNFVFFQTLLASYNTYITDLYKVFFRIKSNTRFKASNSIIDFTAWGVSETGKNIHAQILSREIEAIRPDLILTLGNASRDKLLELNHLLYQHDQKPTPWLNNLQLYQWNKSTPILSSPHISNASNTVKAALLNQPKYSHIAASYLNEKLAKIICSEANRILPKTNQ